MKLFPSLAAALVITLAPALALAQDAIREVRVQFPHGTSSTTLTGTLKGREIIDYKLGATAGQHMTVTLTTDNTGNYFNLLAPGETEVAFFVGSTEGNRFEGSEIGVRPLFLLDCARRRGVSAGPIDQEGLMIGPALRGGPLAGRFSTPDPFPEI